MPNSLKNLPPNSYPLVVTLQKFLMMLDGSVGDSYFVRFRDLSSGFNSLEKFVEGKLVSFERFDSVYWPRFNSKHTKNMNSSCAFAEITSYIKGGKNTMDTKLSLKDYLALSENRGSSLSNQQRQIIYCIYESYEKCKMDRGEFDLVDIVADIHCRLKSKTYEGEDMHYVYIDEVQDFTLSQIALFKYICPNVEEGFTFCGDTAQTITKGVDFRFQDIKAFFYDEFNKGKDQVRTVSETFQLTQNYRTHVGVLNLSQSTIDLLIVEWESIIFLKK